MAKIEAVLEHRRMLVSVRTLVLHHVADQITKLPVEIRDQLTTNGKIEGRLRRLEQIDTSVVSTMAGSYRLSWLIPLVEQDRAARCQIRQLEHHLDNLLDEHGTTLRDEPGIGPIAAATLIVEVGDPSRFARESKFARWCGTGAIALSSGEGAGLPVKHRLDFPRQPPHQQRPLHRQRHPAAPHRRRPGLHRPEARRGQDPPTSAASPQTPSRQPRHPTHVDRRVRPPPTPPPPSSLTRERPTLPRRVPPGLSR